MKSFSSPSDLPSTCGVALKEWAVTVSALNQGSQVLLLRKGGIREEGKDFRVIYPEFFLYPTYEHQRPDLLKTPYQDELERVLAIGHPSDSITFTHWAKVDEVVELMEQEKVDALSAHYIWTADYAEKRLHWKPRKPLSLLLVRVYRLGQPKEVPYLDRYSGCKSWVDLAQEVSLGSLSPVLSDEEFQKRVNEVRGTLGLLPVST